MTELSVIILTWNSEPFIRGCLDSVLGSVVSFPVEVIVVDNGSRDNTPGIIHEEYRQVILLRNSRNLGVSQRNRGIAAATGRYLVFLDSDTVLQPDTLSLMHAYLEDNPDAGIAGPSLLYGDGTRQTSARRFPLVQGKLLRRMPRSRPCRTLEREEYPRSLLEGKEAFDVDYIIGACLMARKPLVDELGGFDARIFYGPEDVDFCLRAWLGGWKVRHLPFASLTHYQQRITKTRVLSYVFLRHIQGLAHYFIKHRYAFSRRRLYRRMEVNRP